MTTSPATMSLAKKSISTPSALVRHPPDPPLEFLFSPTLEKPWSIESIDPSSAPGRSVDEDSSRRRTGSLRLPASHGPSDPADRRPPRADPVVACRAQSWWALCTAVQRSSSSSTARNDDDHQQQQKQQHLVDDDERPEKDEEEWVIQVGYIPEPHNNNAATTNTSRTTDPPPPQFLTLRHAHLQPPATPPGSAQKSSVLSTSSPLLALLTTHSSRSSMSSSSSSSFLDKGAASALAENHRAEEDEDNDDDDEDDETVYLYAVHPQKAVLLLWSWTRTQFRRQQLATRSSHHYDEAGPPSGWCPVAVAPCHASPPGPNTSHTTSRLSCLQASWHPGLMTIPLVVVGTLHGMWWWIIQTRVPLSLVAQPIQPTAAPTTGSFLLSSWTKWSSWLGGGSTTTTTYNATMTPQKRPLEPLHAMMMMGNTSEEDQAVVAMWSWAPRTDGSLELAILSASGIWTRWTVVPTESCHKFVFHMHPTPPPSGDEDEVAKKDRYQRRRLESPRTAPRREDDKFALKWSSLAQIMWTLADLPPQTQIRQVRVLETAPGRDPAPTFHAVIRVTLQHHPAAGSGASAMEEEAPNDTVLTARDEERLYWIRYRLVIKGGTATGAPALPHDDPNDDDDDDAQVQVTALTWLNRFATPEMVRVLGLTVTDQGWAYAALGQAAAPAESRKPVATTTLALHDRHLASSSSFTTLVWMAMPPTGDALIHEMDMSSRILSPIPRSLEPDMTTNGCTALDQQTGRAVRIRVRLDFLQPQQPLERPTVELPNAAQAAGPHLLSHLRSAYTEAYMNPDRSIRVPPSVRQADPAVVEGVVLDLAKELQKQPTVQGWPSSNKNPIEGHLTLIHFLQQSGLYRSLSLTTQWRLLGIGQEMAAFWALKQQQQGGQGNHTEWERGQWATLSSTNVAEWLYRIQEACLDPGAVSDSQRMLWLHWLCVAMDAALGYRETRAQVDYYIAPNRPPLVPSDQTTPVYTSNLSFIVVWERLLKYWRSKAATATSDVVEKVAQYALQSFGDAYLCSPSTATKLAYSFAQETAFRIVRQVKGIQLDRFAYELAGAHRFFHGLCEIAVDHEHRDDRSDFLLEPMFEHMANVQDLHTDMSFGLFVLKWHVDRQLFGHVLEYGKLCPIEFNLLLNTEPALQKYQWVHAIRQGHYDVATTALLRNSQPGNASVSEARFALGMASLANELVEKESLSNREAAAERRQVIEKRRELVITQLSLMERLDPGRSADSAPLRKQQQLLAQALEQFDNAKDKADRIQCCLLALAICSSFESESAGRVAAIHVWRRVIAADAALWARLLQSETDLTDSTVRDEVYEHTLFGGLMTQCEEMDGWENVTYRPAIALDVVQGEQGVSGFDAAQVAGLHRLLQSVTSEEHDLSAGV